MPAKHIDDETWRKVEKETLRAIQENGVVYKETQILKALILKGLESVDSEDYERLTKKRA